MSGLSILNSKTSLKSKLTKEATAFQPKRPSMFWWLFGLVLLALCVLMQMPASWVVQKLAADNDNIQWVSGNLWQGSLSWQLPMQGKPPLVGSVNWQWQPSQLLLARVGADIEVVSGSTRLQGSIAKTTDGWRFVDINGRIGADTLQMLVDWQLPNAPIEVRRVGLVYDADSGFEKANGMMNWVGGQMGYPSGGQVFEITLPAMSAQLATKKVTADKSASVNNANNQQALHLQLLDEQGKRLGDVLIDADGMMDVNLTQRLLEHMPDYTGSAPKDSVVVTVRQPLMADLSVSQEPQAMQGEGL